MKKTARHCLFAFAFTLSHNLFAEEGSPTPRHPAMPVTTPNRSIYLNGVDISSARNQDLRNVHIKISENGDLFISAPQYQVTEEETFMPLSSYMTKSAPPEHKPPQTMGANIPAIQSKTGETSTGDTPPAKSAADKVTPAATAPVQPASQALPRTGG